MAHVFRKTKLARPGDKLVRCESPEEPPTPDLSHLTPEEINILQKVIQRQEEFENEEASCIWAIRQQLEQYEDAVRAQGSGKGRLKHIDLRLCRLCFKTKFADGIGRLCHDCRKRVCQRCGGFTKGRWDPKKKKMVRGRWRCNMCDMKRKFFCKTGVWYHGQRARPTLNRALFSQKTRSLEADLTEDESRWRTLSPASSDAVVTDTDLPRAHVSSFQAMMQTRGRRKSMPIFRTESVDISDNDSDEDPYNRSSRRRRSRRQSRRHCRKSRQTSPAQAVRTSLGRYEGNDTYENSYPNAGEIEFISCDLPNQGELFYYMSGDSDNDSIGETSEHLSNRKPDGQSHDSSEHLVNVLSPDHMGSISYGGRHDPQFLYPANKNPERIVIDSACRDIERRFSNEPEHRYDLIYNTPRTERRRKNPIVDPKYLTPENPERNRSYSSDSNSSMRSFVSSITDHDHAEIHQIPFTQDYLTSLEPREILLYRDVKDQSTRSSGLGMRVMFGKKGYGRKLGAFVSKVEKNGPADSYGIRKGDQILLWNGKSLMGTTLEESMDVIGQSSDVVQLLVVHHTTSFSDNEDMSTNTCENTLPYSTTTRGSDDRSNCATPPTTLNLTRKRRMLPKTPVEIKKEDRNVSGCVRMLVSHEDSCLSITLISAENLVSVDPLTSLNPVVMVHILPNRGCFPMHQTQLQYNTANPNFNETFNFHDIYQQELRKLSLEVTLWTVVDDNYLFLGEVLLDFCDLQLDNQVHNYDLQDHDENSSPLPVRKRKESSDVTTASPLTSINDGSSWSTSPGVQSSPRREPLHCDDRYHVTSGFTNGRDRRFKLNVTQSVPNSPQLSPISASEESMHLGGETRGSITTLVRKRVSNAMSKVSALSGDSRRHSMYDRRKDKLSNRSSSVSDATLETSGRVYDNPSPISRRSAVSTVSGTEELGKPPQPLNTGDSAGHFLGDEEDSGGENEASGVCTTSGRLDPDGNDVTSLLGPGQVPPKPSSETSICGTIRLAFMVSKGQLELDIINVTDLNRNQQSSPPDTYVKAYLVGGSKVIQKKKTHTVKASFSPFFRRTIKYSACNIHGRAIKVILWARHGAFDKKQSLGEAVVKLDGLDLMHQSTNWYKLFPPGATDFGSNESLNFW
ncbi:regulating synaptic membrane exocytosis protein 2-like [Saccostrea echinata]|uniref:regulating synaptic membrane exocytosis protein 2-like n=1 Tax=Saccostrea echinata TaxID=191078 RepID=UPI002A83870E|nr:regulating synaptic membrane exocytosis protein 2-like [Saccostrea echinata]